MQESDLSRDRACSVVRQLDMCRVLLQAASMALDVEEAYRRVSDSLHEIGGYPVVSAHMKQGGVFVSVTSLGYPGPCPGAHRGIHGRLLRTGEPQFVPDVRADPDYVEVRSDITGEICVPVKLEDEVVGILNIESNGDRPLTEEDFSLMLALGDQMSLVVRNALLHQRLEVERDAVHSLNRKLMALQAVSTAVSSHRDVQEVLDSIVESAVELIEGESGYIFMLDDHGKPTIKGSYGTSPQSLEAEQEVVGGVLTELVVGSAQPLIINDTASGACSDIVAVAEAGIRSFISLPLRLEKSIIGALHVCTRTHPRVLNRDDLQILSLLAGQALVAYENARLYALMAESEQRYHSIFADNLDGIVLIDVASGLILEANQAFQEMLGYSLEELRQRKIWELHAEEQRHRTCREWIERVAAGHAGWRLVPYLSKDGRRVEAEFFSRIIELQGRSLEIGSVRDVTEKLRLQDQVRQTQKMEAVGTLASGIAHDFNNLLGAILGYASYLKSTLDENDSRRADVEVIANAARRGAALTSQLLTFAHGGPHQLVSLDLNTVVKEVIQLLSRTVDRAIEIRRVLQEDIGTIQADVGQIQQLLLNLCLNACEAMPEGGVLTIRTEAVHIEGEQVLQESETGPGMYIKLSVSDTGLGVPPEIQKRIFEPFFSTKKDASKGRHSGLGLAVVFGIVKGHGGHITVESEFGRGTTFDVFLPVKSGDVSSDPAAESEVPPGGSETILVVDDEETIRDLMERILKQAGYQVIVSANGLEALDIFRNRMDEIDLVILDMVMPGLGGLQTYLRIKETNPKVVVLVASGYTDQEQAQKTIEMGAHGFLQKPFSLEEVLCKIRTVLDEAAG